MVRVMITCPRTGQPIYTGLELPVGSPLTGYAKRKVQCVHCSNDHGIRRPFFEGHGPDEFHKYFVALDCEPDFAAEVGVLISCFAMVESYAPQLLSRLLKIDDEEAFAIMSSFDTFSGRIELLKTLVNLQNSKGKQTDEKRAVSRLLPRLSAATNIRNKYAHGRYSITLHDDFTIDSFVTSRKPKRAQKSLDAMVEDVNTFKRLICDLHGYLYRKEMPPSWP
jgi:hypothetical protein